VAFGEQAAGGGQRRLAGHLDARGVGAGGGGGEGGVGRVLDGAGDGGGDGGAEVDAGAGGGGVGGGLGDGDGFAAEVRSEASRNERIETGHEVILAPPKGVSATMQR
jgi:hypothetical protein